jgi:hypothetical protein
MPLRAGGKGRGRCQNHPGTGTWCADSQKSSLCAPVCWSWCSSTHYVMLLCYIYNTPYELRLRLRMRVM